MKKKFIDVDAEEDILPVRMVLNLPNIPTAIKQTPLIPRKLLKAQKKTDEEIRKEIGYPSGTPVEHQIGDNIVNINDLPKELTSPSNFVCFHPRQFHLTKVCKLCKSDGFFSDNFI